jgi:hypothetical protein
MAAAYIRKGRKVFEMRVPSRAGMATVLSVRSRPTTPT